MDWIWHGLLVEAPNGAYEHRLAAYASSMERSKEPKIVDINRTGHFPTEDLSQVVETQCRMIDS